MTNAASPEWEPVTPRWSEIFPSGNEGNHAPYAEIGRWNHPITYFVGRNGSGKSRTARAVSQGLGGKFLSTDRLLGVMQTIDYGWGAIPVAYKGPSIGTDDRESARARGANSGNSLEDLYALREQPDVWLRVAAFLRRALGRTIELRETAGHLDPYVRQGNAEYSLLREEGHGLRQLVILLTAAYRADWSLLVVDEPELHLHPSLVRLWMTELRKECLASGRRALIVTHEPTLLMPKDANDLEAIWYFAPNKSPQNVSDQILGSQEPRVSASLIQNPQLVSQLMFSPRPVLVEGITDVTALATALARTAPAEVVAQTDFVECGGSGLVAMWFEIGTKLGIDLKAVADLDAIFTGDVQRAMDARTDVTDAYRRDLLVEPPRTRDALTPLRQEMDRAHIEPNERARALWMAAEIDEGSGHAARRDKLLSIWRDAGLWLHPQGTLENVLGISQKGTAPARAAAQIPGPIDDVALWCAFQLDPLGDVEALLNAAVERIAHEIMEVLRLNPEAIITAPVGTRSISDARIVAVQPRNDGRYRITVLAPQPFAGYWLEFSRNTPSNDLKLQPALPIDPAHLGG